jgi:hypothetical protein
LAASVVNESAKLLLKQFDVGKYWSEGVQLGAETLEYSRADQQGLNAGVGCY